MIGKTDKFCGGS